MNPLKKAREDSFQVGRQEELGNFVFTNLVSMDDLDIPQNTRQLLSRLSKQKLGDRRKLLEVGIWVKYRVKREEGQCTQF